MTVTVNLSLADRAVSALSAVAAIGEIDTGLDRPERHTIRNIKREAEEILRAAFSQAEGLASMAKELPSLVDKIRLEESKKPAQSETA